MGGLGGVGGRAGEEVLLVRGERGFDLIGVRGDGLGELRAVEHGRVGTLAFTRTVAAQLRDHDDREQFLAGLDLILAGIRGRSDR